MTELTGTFKTQNASKYLQQLCKHFAHKVEASCDETHGRVAFPMGEAQLAATPEALTVRFALTDPEALERAKGVIDSHLERFAFREEFKAMEWSA